MVAQYKAFKSFTNNTLSYEPNREMNHLTVAELKAFKSFTYNTLSIYTKPCRRPGGLRDCGSRRRREHIGAP